MVERHAFVEVIGSSPILVLFYFLSILGKEIFKNVVKNLSLGDLELILCDWYEMDEYLSFLGLDEVDGGDVIGWDICYMIEEMDCYWLDFDNHKTTLEDGLECIIIDTMALSKFE